MATRAGAKNALLAAGLVVLTTVIDTVMAKDAGRRLPGFGGLLDRTDSLLVALAVAVIL